jgi:hypothetical protein
MSLKLTSVVFNVRFERYLSVFTSVKAHLHSECVGGVIFYIFGLGGSDDGVL